MEKIDLYHLELNVLEWNNKIETLHKNIHDTEPIGYNIVGLPDKMDYLELYKNTDPNIYRISNIKMEFNPNATKNLVIDNQEDTIIVNIFGQHHHMLFEVVARFLTLLKYCKTPNPNIIFVYKNNVSEIGSFAKMYENLFNLFKALNINLIDKMIYFDEYKTIYTNSLITTDYQISRMFDKYGNSVKLLRKNFRKIQAPTKNIYVSRKFSNDTGNRKVLNEEILENFYSMLGYEIVYLENFPIMEQILLFSQARNVVGLVGSGLSNVVFANQKTKFLEIRNFSKYLNNDHKRIANFCDIEYNIVEVFDTQDANDIVYKLKDYYGIS